MEMREEGPLFLFSFSSSSISTHSSLKFADKALCRSIKSARIRKKKKEKRKKEKERKKEDPGLALHLQLSKPFFPSRSPSSRIIIDANG